MALAALVATGLVLVALFAPVSLSLLALLPGLLVPGLLVPGLSLTRLLMVAGSLVGLVLSPLAVPGLLLLARLLVLSLSASASVSLALLASSLLVLAGPLLAELTPSRLLLLPGFVTGTGLVLAGQFLLARLSPRLPSALSSTRGVPSLCLPALFALLLAAVSLPTPHPTVVRLSCHDCPPCASPQDVP